MSLLARRRAMMGAKASANRFYIFKDGQYQSWLNGRTLVVGGYKTNNDRDSTLSSSVTIENNNIVFTLVNPSNRKNHTCAGVKISDLLPSSVKKIGGTLSCTNYEDSTSQAEDYGMAEKFVTTTSDIDTALGEYQLEYISSAGSREQAITIQNANYVVFHLMRNNAYTRKIIISELWVEV